MLEAYAVAVRVRLIDGVTAGLMGLSGAFARAHGDAGKLQKQLDSIKFRLAAGGAMLGAGALGFWMIGKAVKPAEEYAHQLNIMRMAGMSNLDIANATALAWKNTGTVITTTATENLRAIVDLKNILGSLREARWALPIVTKVGAVMASSSEANVKANAQDIAFQMAKALDIIGAARNPQQFAHEAGLMSKVVTAFQNRVTPKQFQGVFQYARQAKFDLSDEFKYEFLPSLMLEMSGGGGSSGGGSRGVGPMLAALYRVTNQGYINKKSVPLWEQLGLLKPGTALSTTTTGTVTAGLKDRALAAQNPFLFATKVLEPAIKAKFGANITAGKEREIIGELFRGNQLAAAAMMEFISKPQNFLRDQQIIRHAMPYDQAYRQAQQTDPAFQWMALHKQYENAMTALGIAALPLVIRGVRALAQTIQPLGTWLMAHPDMTKGLVLGFGALSAAMAFGGTVLLLSAAFSGLGLLVPVLTWGFGALAAGALALSLPVLLVTGGIAAVGTALFQMWKHWDTTKTVWQNIKSEFGMFFGWLSDKVKGLLGFFGIHIAAPAPHMKPLAAQGGLASIGQPDQAAMRKYLGASTVPQPGKIAAPAPAAPGPWQPRTAPQAPPQKQASVTHITNIHLDGKQIARAVSQHQGDDAAAPATGPTRFDPLLSPWQSSMTLAPGG